MPPLEMILKSQHMVVKHLNLETWKYYYVGKNREVSRVLVDVKILSARKLDTFRKRLGD